MVFLLSVVCLIWLALLQQKIDKMSKSVDYLLRKSIDNIEKPLAQKAKPEVHKEEKTSDVQPEPVAASVVKSEPSYNIPKTVKKKDDFELQNVFLGNIFNKIGAVAIIVAVIIFIKLVSPFIVITPLMKIVLGFLSGFGMVGGAQYMHKKDNLKNYSEVLLGTGFATLFITTFCGYSMFHLYSTGCVLTIGALLLVSTFVLAQQMRTVSMLVIGLIGGYLTPCFSGVGYETAMWYLIFLNMVSLIFTLKNQSYKWINVVNLIITMFAFVPYVIEPTNTLLPVVLWGIYIIYDILRDKSNPVDYALSFINYGVLTLFAMLLFRSSHEFLGYMLAIAAIVYVGFAFYSYVSKNQLYKTYIYYALLNLWLEVLFLLNDLQSVVVWSLVGFVLAFVCAKYKQRFLTGAIFWYFSIAFVGALLARVDHQFVMFAHYAPIVNFRTLIFGIPVISLLISAYMFKKEAKLSSDLLLLGGVSLGYLYLVGEINSIVSQIGGENNYNKVMLYVIVGLCYVLQTKRLYKSTNNVLFNVASWTLMPLSLLALFIGSGSFHLQTGYLPVVNVRFAAYVMAILVSIIFVRWTKSEFYKYLAVILGFILVYCEAAGLSHLYSNMTYLISVGWILYSGIVTISGILLNKRYLINSGIFLVILSILRIFIFDLAKVEAFYKLIAFLALGIILMLVSYIYNFHKNNNK